MKDDTSIKALETAEALLSRPNGWCQGEFFRRKDGRAVLFGQVRHNRPPAQCCLIGALDLGAMRAVGREPGSGWGCVSNAIVAKMVGQIGQHLGAWNDDPVRTQAEVVELVRSVRAQLEAAESEAD